MIALAFLLGKNQASPSTEANTQTVTLGDSTTKNEEAEGTLTDPVEYSYGVSHTTPFVTVFTKNDTGVLTSLACQTPNDTYDCELYGTYDRSNFSPISTKQTVLPEDATSAEVFWSVDEIMKIGRFTGFKVVSYQNGTKTGESNIMPLPVNAAYPEQQ
jgi:hypothetical protein